MDMNFLVAGILVGMTWPVVGFIAGRHLLKRDGTYEFAKETGSLPALLFIACAAGPTLLFDIFARKK